MEVVDRLVLDTFQRLDESFFEDVPFTVETVADLSTDKVFEGIVLLLWTCDSSLRSTISSKKLPVNMALRFRAASNVVDAIKAVGVRDEIRYQALLYGQAKELRNVIIGLIEKLPKESAFLTTPKSPLLGIVDSAFSLLRAASDCSTLSKYCLVRHAACTSSACRRVEFVGFSGDVRAALRSAKEGGRLRGALLCAALDANHRSAPRPHTRVFVLRQTPFEKRNFANVISTKPSPLWLSKKPAVPPRPSGLALKGAGNDKKASKIVAEFAESEKKSSETEENMLKLSAVLDEICALRCSTERKTQDAMKLKFALAKDTTSLVDAKSLESDSDARLRHLVETPDAAAKLAKFVDEGEERMEELQNRWVVAKTEKELQLKNEQQKRSLLVDPAAVRHTALELSAAADNIERRLSDKRNRLTKLKNRVDKMENSSLNRSAYTKRIFDIVANINKQQEGIDKVLDLNKQLQKEIKSLCGKLDRTFTVVEDCFYRESQRDASMHKGYRLLVKIHEGCSWVVSAIESSGCLNRDIDEINDQTVMQQQKGVDETLEKALNDWIQVKQENAKLEQALAHT